MNDEYYIQQGEEKIGPFTFEELMNNDIDIHTSILAPGQSKWQYASELPELYEYFEAKDIYFPTMDNLATAGQRTLAFIIDYLLLTIFMELIALQLGWVTLPTDGKFIWPDNDTMFKMQGLFYGIYIAYNVLFEMTGWKATIGKKICSLRVIDVNGEKISILQSLGRNMGAILSIALTMIPFLSIFGSEYKQEWYDNLAKTYMIKITK
ncbi:MAG: RDD family protein [Sphingobacteriaceae bacterium]|nr:MAG: RDD family protein [Sphingobacteriaceae bacterium]